MTTSPGLTPALDAQLLSGHVAGADVQPLGHHDVEHANDGQWQQIVDGCLGNYYVSAKENHITYIVISIIEIMNTIED